MEIKILLCNCKGLCDSFRQADMNTLPFSIESEMDVSYTVLHPQLCGPGGHALLADALAGAGPDTRVLVGACEPEAQRKLFRKLMRAAGFPEEHLVPVDIRGTDNEGILRRIRDAIQDLLETSGPVAAGATD